MGSLKGSLIGSSSNPQVLFLPAASQRLALDGPCTAEQRPFCRTLQDPAAGGVAPPGYLLCMM